MSAKDRKENWRELYRNVQRQPREPVAEPVQYAFCPIPIPMLTP